MKTDSNHLEKQLAKTKAEKTGEKIRAFASEAKIELPPEVLEAINGGMGMTSIEADRMKNCQNCGSSNLETFMYRESAYGFAVRCKNCGFTKY